MSSFLEPDAFIFPTFNHCSNHFLSSLLSYLLKTQVTQLGLEQTLNDFSWKASPLFSRHWNELGSGVVLKSVLSCFFLALMEAEETTDSTAHTLPLWRMTYSTAESLENGWSLWPYRTLYTEIKMRWKFQICSIQWDSWGKWSTVPTEISLTAIKSLFVGALTASGKLNKPIFLGCW